MSNLRSRQRHQVKISRKSYSTLEDLITKGLFVCLDATPLEVKGIRPVVTYQLHSMAPITLRNDRTLDIGGTTINGCYAHVPSPAHQALVAASPAYAAYPCLDRLLTAARTPTTDPGDVARMITDCLRQGAQPTNTAPMITPSQQFRARWCAAETLLHRTDGGDYYLTLTFDVTFDRAAQVSAPCAVGIDVGLSPVAALQYEDGKTQVIPATPIVRPDLHKLSCRGQALLDDITYASGRQDAEQVVRHLVYGASHVFAERLRLGEMNRSYVMTSRDRALQDFHFAWLPQYLWTAGIPLRRVAAGYTSTECPACRHTCPDNRVRGHFRCRQCGFGGDG